MFGYRSVLTATLAVALQSLTTDARPHDAPEWRKEFASALAESADSGRPLLVCFNADLDGEAGNREMALRVYRDARLVRAMGRIVAVIGSIDGHEHRDGVCSRFGHIDCPTHRTIERAARRHLFGDRREMYAPQHVLLFPDGSVAWHELYVTSAAQLRRAIGDAERTWKKSERSRIAEHVSRFRKLVRGAGNDTERYFVLRTTFEHAPAKALSRMLRATPQDLAERLLSDFATSHPERALQSLGQLGADCPKPLRELVGELHGRLATNHVNAYVDETSEPTEPKNDPPRRRRPPGHRPLPVLGSAARITGAQFGEQATPALAGTEGAATVLLFFLPDDRNLDRQRELWNRFVERMDGRPVRTIGLGASIAPTRDLVKTRASGFGFPVGNYLFERSVAPYGITSFPAAVVLDDRGRVRFQGDAYGAFERAVERLLPEITKLKPAR